MKRFTLNTTLMGIVTDVQEQKGAFKIKCRSGDEFLVLVGRETQFTFLKNLDDINRDRIPNPQGFNNSEPSQKVKKYIQPNRLVVLQGVYQDNDGKQQFEARTVRLLQSSEGEYLFEQSHWWLTQIARLADSWLGYLFPNKQSYEIDDFALYRTNLNIIGLPTDDTIQECATLSRLIYGLSSAYLLTGCERYLSAARAAVDYQRETFRVLTEDGKHCLWAFGKRKTLYSYELYMSSLRDNDKDTIPLYEQIYAIAGLAQYYRITLDWEVLDDIKRTVRTFNDHFLDPKSEYGEHAYGDYFSNLDYVTYSWDSDSLAHNKAKKNWNSIGDHIPAYLINVILALEPLPKTDHGYEGLQKFLETCKKILKTASTIIVEKFPDPDPNVPFVNERFFRDWKPDHSYQWQQNRAVVGHNLKIAWNLTRVANYYNNIAVQSASENKSEAQESKQLADKLMNLTNKLGISMAEVGVDLFRGGIFDVVERNPQNGMYTEFPWLNTKDFWQQEQALLAYLILHGCTEEGEEQKQEYLHLAQEIASFWNLFFVDLDNKGIFFRVTDIGTPVIEGRYSYKAKEDIAGYHAFELNYLAHVYISTYVTKKPFCLYFKPNKNCRQRSINVLPDFVKPNSLEISRISIDGSERAVEPNSFQVQLGEKEFQLGSEAEIIVEFRPLNSTKDDTSGKDDTSVKPLAGKKIAVLVESEFIPEEITAYQHHFKELGATVDFMSRLWGNKSLRFLSDIDQQGEPLHYLDVNIDFQDVDINDYAAVIMAANYTSVRLRYFQPQNGQPITQEDIRSAPAVQFFAKAMANPKIIKGFLCHGLWILTPMPELLKGRKVICHEVVVADVVNAGAIYTPSSTNIVVDGDVVTGRRGDDVHAFIDAIANLLTKQQPKASLVTHAA